MHLGGPQMARTAMPSHRAKLEEFFNEASNFLHPKPPARRRADSGATWVSRGRRDGTLWRSCLFHWKMPLFLLCMVVLVWRKAQRPLSSRALGMCFWYALVGSHSSFIQYVRIATYNDEVHCHKMCDGLDNLRWGLNKCRLTTVSRFRSSWREASMPFLCCFQDIGVNGPLFWSSRVIFMFLWFTEALMWMDWAKRELCLSHTWLTAWL